MSNSKTIIFRVSGETYERIEKAASASGQDPNEWSRNLVTAAASEEINLTPNERIIFEEVAKLRYLVGVGLGFLSTDELTKKNWDETKLQVDNSGEKIADQLLAKRKKR